MNICQQKVDYFPHLMFLVGYVHIFGVKYKCGGDVMNRLKDLRKKRKLSQLELSKELNIDRTTISRLEQGKASFTQEQIQNVSKFFGVSTDYVLGLSEYKVFNMINKNIYAEEIEVYSQIFGGRHILREDYLEYKTVVHALHDLSDCVCLISSKDIPEERIFKGDVLIIKLDHQIEPGLFVLAINEMPGEVRRLIENDHKLVFTAENKIHGIDNYQVLGKIISITRKVE